MGLVKILKRKAHLIGQYIDAKRNAPRCREEFQSVQCFCMFIGYPRSGHSLLGSLLDAHPNIIISHELHALRFIRYRFGRDQLFYEIVKQSRMQAEAGRSATGYSYVVPNQWQGRYRTLRVIGDKRGASSVSKLRAQPQLLQRLHDTVGIPVKFIHATRNPFDNIATMFRRAHPTLRSAIESYFYLAEGVAQLRTQIAAENLFELSHEGLIENPKLQIANLCTFLGVDAPEDYLTDCSEIVYKTPNQTRKNSVWTPELISEVHQRLQAYPFLSMYRFEE